VCARAVGESLDCEHLPHRDFIVLISVEIRDGRVCPFLECNFELEVCFPSCNII